MRDGKADGIMREAVEAARKQSGYHDAREGVKDVDCYAAVVNDRRGVKWEMMNHARLR